MSALQCDNTQLRNRREMFGCAACTESTTQGKKFELILTAEMEIRHPIDGSLLSEFSASIIIAEL